MIKTNRILRWKSWSFKQLNNLCLEIRTEPSRNKKIENFENQVFKNPENSKSDIFEIIKLLTHNFRPPHSSEHIYIDQQTITSGLYPKGPKLKEIKNFSEKNPLILKSLLDTIE